MQPALAEVLAFPPVARRKGNFGNAGLSSQRL